MKPNTQSRQRGGATVYTEANELGAPTAAWLQENNRIAAAIPRGTSTPESRRAYLQGEYERLAGWRMAVWSTTPDKRPANNAAPQGEATRFPQSDYSGGGTEFEAFDAFVKAAYGAGRALERATQEARFGRVIVGQAHELKARVNWSDRLRKS